MTQTPLSGPDVQSGALPPEANAIVQPECGWPRRNGGVSTTCHTGSTLGPDRGTFKVASKLEGHWHSATVRQTHTSSTSRVAPAAAAAAAAGDDQLFRVKFKVTVVIILSESPSGSLTTLVRTWVAYWGLCTHGHTAGCHGSSVRSGDVSRGAPGAASAHWQLPVLPGLTGSVAESGACPTRRRQPRPNRPPPRPPQHTLVNARARAHGP